MSLSKQRLRVPLQTSIYVLVIIFSIVLTLAALRVFPQHRLPKKILHPTQASLPAVVTLASQSPVSSTDQWNFVTAAVNHVGPSVVRLETEQTIQPNPSNPFFEDPFFRQFFGQEFLPRLPSEFHQHGEGSGFIIEANGIVLTNAHVVSGVDSVKVTLKDGRTFPGRVQGIDLPSDLAVIQFEGKGLPVAPLGDSDLVQVGDWAIAVGNPFGLDNTVTLGIISTLNRSSNEVGIPDKRLDFMQTDAAINPGNSGGPLLNESGEVIGINTAIRAEAQGIGFAIPINIAKAIKDPLARGEAIAHPYLGIRMVPLTPTSAKKLNHEVNTGITVPEMIGVLVIQVLAQSPAEAVGLQAGDVITEIDNQRVTTADQVQDIVARSLIGEALQLRVQRGPQLEKVSIRPADLQNASRS